jgi:SAM-dependent methyltransferase
MNENPAASDWAATRGEKWRSQLAGMEAMITPVDQPLIHALHLDAPCRIADIECGGGTTLEILRRVPAGSVVHGFDISPALIELARARRAVRLRGLGPSGRKSVDDDRTRSRGRTHRHANARSRSTRAVPLC